MTGHSARAGRALQSLAETDPALAALSLWCDHRDGDATRSSGVVITYGPDFTARPLHEQIALAAHHILHVALRHSARMQALATRFGPGFDAALFNLAADALVNEALAPLRLESLERYRPAVWRARGWQSITPREEATTAETLLRNKLAAPSDLAAERGQDFEELVSRYAADMRTLAAAGLHLPTAVEADAAAPLETDAPPSAG